MTQTDIPSSIPRRLSEAASSVFEETDSSGMSEHAEEEEEENVELGHMQEVIPGLWLGDIIAAMDEESLKAANITAIMSIIRQDIPRPPGIKLLPIPIDDGPSTDILSHLPESVEWIQAAIEAGEGSVLVHCQAGMSRSATVVAAYLMHQLSISPEEAINLIREKRHIIQPSDTFMEQLQLYYLAHCRVSTKDRSTRQWYMERNAAQVMNGGEPPEIDKMAKYPATPTPSMPPTPPGGLGTRKIRCKMCRRHLATRDHMMDHILDQSPASRPRTPSTSIHLPSPLSTPDGVPPSQPRSRTPSISQTARPLSGLGGPRSSDMSHSNSQPGGSLSTRIQDRRNSENAPGSRKYMDAESLASRLPPQLAALRAGVPPLGSKLPGSISPFTPSSVMDIPVVDSPKQTSPTIPPPAPSMHSRATSRDSSSNAESIASPSAMAIIPPSHDDLSPPGLNTTPSRQNSLRAAGLVLSPEGSGSSSGSGPGDVGDRSEGQKTAARKLSMLALTPSEGGTPTEGRPQVSLDTQLPPNALSGRRNSASQSPSFPLTGPPILVNPKCSGYFVEPLTWMEPMLAAGELQGKIICPNDKCGAKIGSYDWAGVQCGCKEWVVPGFCISRSKVDEVW